MQGYSLDAQVRACRSFAEAHEWEVVSEYVDEGRSARSDDIAKRPEFKRMMDDPQDRLFDVILVHKLDRFSRNLRVTLEHFEGLGSVGVSFTSITENMDFSSPWGRLALTLLGGLAQFYSDNLGLEVKKGKAERKAQGLYNGLLPFGVRKGDDGVPVPDPGTVPGLEMAFQLAADGKPDREVAVALNDAGYRTGGSHGPRPFTKDSVRGVLQNRFYVGELTNGNGGWTEARHAPLVDHELFDEVQQSRARNRKRPRTIKRSANTYSLSGLLRCVYCEGPVWIHQNTKGRARVYCRERVKGSGCVGRGTFLDVYELQVLEYLGRLVIPEDYQTRILDMYRALEKDEGDEEARRRALSSRLERIQKLYEWGDKAESDYLDEKKKLLAELTDFEASEDPRPSTLERLEQFLAKVSSAWEEGTDEQRNRLATAVFDSVWIRNERVTAVRPRPELRPFFQISEDCQKGSLSGDPDRSQGLICNTSIYSKRYARPDQSSNGTGPRYRSGICLSFWPSAPPTVSAS